MAATLQYVGSSSCAGTGATYSCSLTTLTGGIAGVAATGDLVIVVTGWSSAADGNPGVTTPTGYTEVYDLWANDARDANLSVNWKIMGATPDTSVTVSGFNNAANGGATVVHVWRGANQTTPMDVTPPAGVVTPGNQAHPDSPAITPVTSGAVVLTVGGGTGDAGPLAHTAPTGYGDTRSATGVGSTMSFIVDIASKAWSGSGAEDPAVWTGGDVDTNSDSMAAGTLAIRPANDPPILSISQPDGVGDSIDQGLIYNVEYSLSDPDNIVTVALYYDTDNTGLNGIAISGCGAVSEGVATICPFDTTGVTPGSYYIYGITNDGVNPQVSAYSPGQITINSPPSVLTVGISGSQTADINSGINNVYLGGAFGFTDGTASITAIKISNNGTAGNLSDVRLYYDTVGDGYGGGESCFNSGGCADGAGGTLGSSIAGSLSIIAGNTYYVYVVADIAATIAGGLTVDLQITNPSTDITTTAINTDTVAKNITGSTTIRPNITSITYPITSPLNGSRIGQSITINGAGFGATCDGINNRITIGGAGNVVSCTGTTFSNTSISITNFQYSSGDSYGGAATLLARIGATDDDVSQDMYVYPDIVSLSVSEAREGDTVTINGNHFGTGAGANSVTIDGVTATGCTWSATSLTNCVVPTAINDANNSVTVRAYQGTGGSNSLYDDSTGFGILPKIDSISAASFSDGGYQNGTFTLNGSHFGASPGSISVNGQTQDGTPIWGVSAITGVGIPDTGTDSGNIILTRSDTKTSNTFSTFYIYPQITSFTAGQGDGDVQSANITITGNHFGTGGTGVNILINGANPSSVTWTSSSSLTAVDIPNAGADSGVIVVTNPTTTKSSNNSTSFYIYPQISSLTVPTATPDAAREYLASDSDGIITVNGNHFGVAGSVTVLGSAGTQQTTGTCSGSAYQATCTGIQIPTAIANNSYTGNIIITRTVDTKTNTYAGFRVLPRITDLVPSNGIIGIAVTTNGDHLCQSGVCPGSFSAANKVTFNLGVDATVFTSWSDSAIATAVPAGATTGNVVVTSDTSYTSNALNFTVDPYTTTLATGADPSANTIAPGASATDVNQFTLQTNGGTENITSVTVNLSTSSGVSRLAITTAADAELGFTTSPASGSNVISVSGMSAVSGSATTFKVRVTPLSHTAMPVPNGGAYSITAPVTAWVGGGGNTHTGSDTNPNALTIDNLSPNGATATSTSAGDTSVTIGWTTSNSADFNTSVVLRWAAGSAGSETPTEGQSYSIGATITTATVACVVSSAPSTLQSKIDGTGGSAECTTAALTNGQSYTYKVFGKDTNGNYNTGVLIGTVAPTAVTNSDLHEYIWAWDINDGAYAGRPLGRSGNVAGGTQDNADGEKYQAFIIGSNANEATNDRAIRLRWTQKSSGEINPTITFIYWCTGTDGAGANCPAGVPTTKASAWEIGAPADTFGTNNQIIRFKDSSLITHAGSVTTPVLGADHTPIAGLNIEQKCVSCTITLTNNNHFEHDFSFEFTPDMPVPANNIKYQIRMKLDSTVLPVASMHGGESTGQGFWTVPTNYSGILNAPTGVSALAGDQQITLNWTPSTSSANSQMIFRSTSVGGPYIPIKQFYNNTTATYIDTGLTNGTTYYYIIRANKTGVAKGSTLAEASIGSLNSTEVSAMPNVLELIVSTSGSQTANFDSGTGNNYLGGAFTFSINIGTANVTGIKVSNNGTAGNLSDVRLYYDTVGDGYGGGESCFNSGGCADGAGGALGASIGGTINMAPGNTYYVYVVADIAGTVAGGTTIDLQITNPSTDITTNIANTGTTAKNITDSTTIRPNVVSYSNSTEPALTDGSREMQTISISGAGFGISCNVAGGSKVTIGAYDLSCTGATFNNTTITITVDSAMPDNNDGGTGSNGLLVTIGATADDARQTFYVYPNVTSITVPTATTDAAREYSVSDSDGIITINGTHFGSAGSVTILGSIADQQTTGTCSGSAYQANCVGLQIPTAIADNSYTGNIVLTRSTGGSKSGTFAGFRVLPRITSLNPNNGITNDPIVIIGNHLCQTGTCPLAGSRSTASDNVIFASGVQVTDGNVTAWGHGDSSTSGVNVNVPAAAITGNVVMKSNNYDSNGITFTKQSSVPNSPTSLNQYRNDGTTAIAVGNKTADGVTSNLVFKASMSGLNPSTLCLQIENAAVGTAFTGAVTAEETGGNCESYTGTPVVGSVTITGLIANTGYHWRARVRNNGTGETGSWVAFGANPSGDGSTDGSPANNDYYIDATAPVTSVISSTGVTASGATITWNTDELADSQVKYDIVCPPVANSTSASQTGGVYSHSVALSNLTPGITYQYQVVSQDRNTDGSLIGNSATGPSAGTCNTFLTSQANMRTAEFIITGETSAATAETIKDFQVYITEQGYSIQNAFIETTGIAGTGGGSSMTLGLKVEGETGTISYTNYTVAIDNAIATPFTILHKIDNSVSDLYIAPTQSTQNKLYINPSSGDSVYIASAKIVVTYYYTPQ